MIRHITLCYDSLPSGKARWLGFLLEDEQQGGATTIGPFHQQGDVQLAKALAEALLKLLLAA